MDLAYRMVLGHEPDPLGRKAGLRVLRRHGLNWLPGMCERGSLSAEEIAAEPGIFDEADECYILAYVVGVE